MQRSRKCESQRRPSTQAPRSRALCAAQRLYLPVEASMSKHRAEQQGSNCSQCTQPRWFQTLMGLHAFFLSFILESPLFLVLLQVNLSLRFVWVDCSKIWHHGSAFSRRAHLAVLMALPTCTVTAAGRGCMDGDRILSKKNPTKTYQTKPHQTLWTASKRWTQVRYKEKREWLPCLPG